MRTLRTLSICVTVWALASSGCAGSFDPPLTLPPRNPGISGGATGDTGQTRAAPPIIGGTLATLPGTDLVVATDPDNDAVYVVKLHQTTEGAPVVVATVKLDPGSEPGRAVIDSKGRAHVVLRGTGELLSFPLASPLDTESRHACVEPRGIAASPAGDRVFVACASGSVVSFGSSGGSTPINRFEVEPDLRDIAVTDAGIFVTRFRSAELLQLGLDGTVTARFTPQQSVHTNPDGTPGPTFTPGVAWRMVADAQGRIVMVHQMGQTTPITLNAAPTPNTSSTQGQEPSPYGGDPSVPCSSIVNAAVSVLENGNVSTTSLSGLALPVDVAPVGAGQVAIAGAGSQTVVTNAFVNGSSGVCGKAFGFPVEGDPVAVAMTDFGLVTQRRNPAVLDTPSGSVILNPTTFADPGHALFHHASTAGGSLACASCHPEGTEDGRTWNFLPIGPRRTQNVSGGISKTAPFHWDGDLSDMSHLVGEVFVRRMGGVAPDAKSVTAMMRWIDSVRPQEKLDGLDTDAVARGKIVFDDADVGCGTCHAGALLTDNESHDVGTGAKLQVPSLRQVAYRAPLMHDGCAATLEDRFGGPCGGGELHGHTSQLNSDQISDLVAYLKSL